MASIKLLLTVMSCASFLTSHVSSFSFRNQRHFAALASTAYVVHPTASLSSETHSYTKTIPRMSRDSSRTHAKDKGEFHDENQKKEFDLYEAEMSAAYDAHDAPDAGFECAAMERAVIMAYEMMAQKRQQLKNRLDGVKVAANEFAMLECATEDLAKKYRDNPADFKRTFSEADTNNMALKMIEDAISVAAERILEDEVNYGRAQALNRQRNFVREEKRKENTFQSVASAAFSSSAPFSESTGRKETLDAEKHVNQVTIPAANQLIKEMNDLYQIVAKSEEQSLIELDKMKSIMTRLHEKQESLKADLDEIEKTINDKLSSEWRSRKIDETLKS